MAETLSPRASATSRNDKPEIANKVYASRKFSGSFATAAENADEISQHRADFFNILNHTNFAMASGNRVESSGTFGQISSTAGLAGGNNGGPRVIQLTGRLTF